MFYKKNAEKSLSEQLFQNPTSEYRGTPFWSWNTKLDKETISEQISHLKEMGFGGFHIHSRTGLDTEYLSAEFMEMVDHAHNEGVKNGMLTWLYDEDRWSSGAAGGKTTVNPIFRRKRLGLYPDALFSNTPKEQALKDGTPFLLGCYDVVLDKDGYIDSYKRIAFDETALGNKWYAYCENEKPSTWFNGFTYPDTGNPDAIKEFISNTYEKYKSTLGNAFGESVPAIFTDEPNINHEKNIGIPSPEYIGRLIYTWSLYFDTEYKKAYGQDILDVLPELIWNKKDRSDSLVKYRFFDLSAHLFATNFSEQLGDWCKENNIAFTGHLLREPELWSQAITCGETMRSYEHFAIPGIDILCDYREFTTAKQAQSVVHQLGKEAMLSELYGVTNWDYDFRGHKSQGDWQTALGVTIRVPHLNWMSMAGEAKRDYPAAIGYQSPWYKEYSYIEDHFARVNTAITRGKPVVKVGVIHPIESHWINIGPKTQCASVNESLEQNFSNITKWLLEGHLDFNYICESCIPKFQNGTAIGQMQYDAIVVPACLNIRSTTLKYLEKFKAAGNKIVFMGACPTFVDGIESDKCKSLFDKCITVNFDKASILEALSAQRLISITSADGAESPELIYTYRNDTDCDWLFIAHSANVSGLEARRGPFQPDVTAPVATKIKIKGEFTPIEYDTLSGEIKPAECEYNNGYTILKRRFYTNDSLLLKLLPGKTKQSIKQPTALKVVKKFEIDTLVEYETSEPNVLLLDCAEYSIDNAPFNKKEELLRADNIARNALGFSQRVGHLAQPYTMKKQPEQHTLTLRFTFHSDIEVENALFAMEDVEKNSLVFNGTPITNTPVGYFTDKSIKTIKLPTIQKGENVLLATLPYGPRTNVEWCYILGNFGVDLSGRFTKIVSKTERLSFSNVVHQKMPFYSANITYKFDIELEQDGYAEINTSYYRGALISVKIDGKKTGNIVFAPYNILSDKLSKGTHRIELTIFGNRFNSFGSLHAVNLTQKYFSPDAWRTEGDDWFYEYNPKPFGILKSPIIKILK